MHFTLASALLTSIAIAQVFDKHTEPFHLGLKSADPAYDGTSLIPCTDTEFFRNLCWWKAPSSTQKTASLRFSWNDYDYSLLGYLNYNWTFLYDVNVQSEWRDLGFTNVPDRNLARIEVARFDDGVIGELVRFAGDGTFRLVKHRWDDGLGQNMLESNWTMCAVEGRNRRNVLHWAHEGAVLDDCVKVDVICEGESCGSEWDDEVMGKALSDEGNVKVISHLG